MNIIQTYTLLFFISILSPINSQWYIIKKDHRPQLMNYPNPGKRSLLEQKSNLLQTDCSMPYSQLQTSQRKVAWLFRCNHKTSSSPNRNSLEDERSTTPKMISQEKRTRHEVPSYSKEHINGFKMLLTKLLRQSSGNQ